MGPEVEADPTYALVLEAMQNGAWQEATAQLAALEARHPRAIEVQHLRRLLALRTSAEANFAAAEGASYRGIFRVPWLRALAVANAVLYLALAALWLVTRVAGRAP